MGVNLKARKGRYLDQLVVKYVVQNIGLDILADAPEGERPRIFLDRIGWGQKKDYLEDALNSYVSEKLPDGTFYVFTPEDGFKYEKRQKGIESSGLRIEAEENTTFIATINDILNISETKRSTGEAASVPLLFFNKDSKEAFERNLQRLERQVAFSVDERELVIDRYGLIRLYLYQITLKLPPQPDK